MISIVHNYVDEEFEKAVLKLVPYKRNPYTRKYRNQVLRWGKITSYHGVHMGHNIPELFERFRKDIEFTSVQINEYFKGQLIDWHIDDNNTGEFIHIINLVNEANIDFRKGQEIKTYTLPRFSFMTFGGEMRTEWQHRVIATNTRYSVVFRNKQ